MLKRYTYQAADSSGHYALLAAWLMKANKHIITWKLFRNVCKDESENEWVSQFGTYIKL